MQKDQKELRDKLENIVKIKTKQIFEDREENYEFKYEANIDRKEEKIYIRYTDENNIKYYIKVFKDEIVINNENKLIFRENTKYKTDYKTPLNILDILIETEKVLVLENEITIEYYIYLDGSKLCKTIYNLKIE